MNEIVNKFLLAVDKFMPKGYTKGLFLLTLYIVLDYDLE